MYSIKKTFREFWNKYVPEVSLPGRTTSCNYRPTVRRDLVKWIKSALNSTWWLCIDETTDIIIKRNDCNSNTITRVVLNNFNRQQVKW
ncbi:hypothetical protein NQ318_009180 [Aromia moschata]|uniref:Transposase n=1 Tax=Aromia moschata TaxID=1265417 RepID=A0AAV8XXT2_9CUCU|nr:hypothetical protein NQ318_009180 [Aromia moschata]